MSYISKENLDRFQKLQEHTGIKFRNEKLLVQAFTHSSYVNENSNNESNERLEFLGDAVLEQAISVYLYNNFPDMPEGQLTKLRAAIVCESSFVKLAEALNLSEYVFLGRGEELSGGRQRPSLLADVFEAFIGSLFIDQGMEAVENLLKVIVFPQIKKGVFSRVVDYKSLLQEESQKLPNSELVYEVVSESGPAHERLFTVEVLINNEKIGQGEGKSKKEAEQNAAEQALKKRFNK